MDGSFRPDIPQLRFAHKHLRRVTVAEKFQELFSSPLPREILAAPAIYVGGFPEDFSYLYYLHVLYATLVRGNAYIRRGSQHLSNVLVKRVKDSGGDVRLRTEVQRILVDGSNHAYGVETNRGTFLGNQIYINASPHYALDHLFPQLDCLPPVQEKLRDLKPSWSTTTLYAVTDRPPEELGLTSSEMMVLSSGFEEASELRQACRGGLADERTCERAFWELSTMEVTNYHLLDPSGGNVICLNLLDDMRHWPSRDTPEYAAKKERASSMMLERLLRYRPELRGHIQYQDCSSPHTYERYTHNHAGAGYGALVGTDTTSHVFHYNFPVQGIHFLSAWVAGPSYEAAFGYAEMKALTYRDS
jgi:phytoene dehydrogenase-like protein